MPTGEPAVTIDNGDIGACDDCGETAEPRKRVLVEATISGTLVRIYGWFCPPCETQRKAKL